MMTEDHAINDPSLDTDDEDMMVVTVEEGMGGERLDKFLAASCPSLSRTRVQQLMQEGAVLLMGADECDDASLKVKEGMVFTILIPPPLDDTPVPENIPLDIVYEDEHLIVLNKPVGLVVHPAPGHTRGTLVNALLYHCGDSLSGIGGVRRPGIVHRLDKDTSGLMMVAKTDKAHKSLSAQLADRTLSRRYLTIVWGAPPLKKGHVEAPIARHHTNRQKMTIPPRGGRHALTYYERKDIYRGGVASLIECRLETGRTHQVRVHMAHLGHPVVGDSVYGLQQTGSRSLIRKADLDEDTGKALLNFPRQALHAWALEFIHPATDEEMSFEAAPPADMDALINLLKS